MSTKKLGRAVKKYSETLRSNREQYSETGAIDWENKWKMRLLTTEVDICSLVALSLNTCPEKAFEFLNKKKEIYKTEKSIDQEIRDFTDKHKKTDPNNLYRDIPLLYGLVSDVPLLNVTSTIEHMEKRHNIIKHHLDKLDTKPVEINGIATVKCNIASFVALLLRLDLPHPKELDNYAIEYTGNLKSFREVVEKVDNFKPSTTEKRRSALKKWLDEQPNDFDPHNHEFTKLEVWEKANIGTPKSESVRNRFFKEVNNLISFKAGRRNQPSQTCSQKVKLDKNNPAIVPLKQSLKTGH